MQAIARLTLDARGLRVEDLVGERAGEQLHGQECRLRCNKYWNCVISANEQSYLTKHQGQGNESRAHTLLQRAGGNKGCVENRAFGQIIRLVSLSPHAWKLSRSIKALSS